METVGEKQNFLGLVNSYSNTDLHELSWMADRLKKGKPLKKCMLQAALAVFEEHTVFSIFEKEKQYLVEIVKFLKSAIESNMTAKIEPEDDTEDSQTIRHLYRVLKLPTPLLSQAR